VLARTSHKTENRTRGLTLFLVDLRQVRAEQPETLEVVPVRTMFNYATNQVHYRGMRVPADHVIGAVDAGFRYVIDGWNAERILLASEAIGDGYWFIERAVDYASKREVFGRQIGANQGVQFPLADAYMKVRAADMMRYEAARLFDEGKHCGAEANMAKHLASEASWAAANVALDTHGGNGFVDQYDIERKFRETRMFQVAPVNNNLIKAFVATKGSACPGRTERGTMTNNAVVEIRILSPGASVSSGATIEVSLFEALAEWVGQPMHFTAGSARQPGRFGAQHATSAPYAPFTDGGGHDILTAIQNEPEWARFCEIVLERPELATDRRFASNTLRVAHRDELTTIIAERFAALPTENLESKLRAARVAFAGVNTVPELLDHPVLRGRDRWRTVQTEAGGIEALLPPLDFGGEVRMDPVPALGQHTRRVLAELGREESVIDKLEDAVSCNPA
jgi:hypothetical protein